MKVLIDEQLPVKLKYRFNDLTSEFFTVRDMNWTGLKNGELIKAMTAKGFNVLLTNDKNLYYQQKISGLQICIININAKTNRYPDVLELLDALKIKLNEVEQHLKSATNGYFIL